MGFATEAVAFAPFAFRNVKTIFGSSFKRKIEQHARIGGEDWIKDEGTSSSADTQFQSSLDDDDEKEYQMKLAEAKAAIAAAKEARAKYYMNKKDRTNSSTPMVPLKPSSLSTSSSSSPQSMQKLSIRSRIEFTDAGTMLVDIPPPGTSANSIVSGAFSVAWFSAVAPATFATGGAGLLFMLPFWAAGGLVAKQAIVDPYMAFQLSIGEYAWSLSKTYTGKTVSKPVEGATDELQGALVELGVIVNEVPQYELRLYTNNNLRTKDGVTRLGLGLPKEELEYLAVEINNHLASIKDFPDDVQLLSDE